MKAISLGVIFASLLFTSAAATLLFPNLGEKLFHKKLGITGDGYKSKVVRETIFSQWVDHWNFNAGLFEQRILINDQFYGLGGPVFIFVSAHGGSEEFWLENSYLTQLAEERAGVIYAIEPRFYGNSRPTPDLSLNSLQLLTINQTIADIASFTTFLRTALAEFGSDRFVLFGYDRGASIATFAHQRNPELFDGVWSSGGPTIPFVSFDFYFFDITLSFENHLSAACSSILMNWYEELEELVLTGQAARITELFALAQPINLSDARQVNLLFYVSSILVAYHFEWGNNGDRQDLCQSILQSVAGGASDLEALAAYLNPAIAGLNLDWNAAIEHLRQTNWDAETSRFGERQAWYTACTEWSWFETSYHLPEAVRTRFQRPFFAGVCNEVFGITNVEITNGNLVSSLTLQIDETMPNVFFTFGGTDPFRLVGVRNDINALSPAAIISGFGKAFDLLRTIPAGNETPEMSQVRATIRQHILSWIN